MTNWLETCQHQLARLEKTSVLADKLITLGNKTEHDLGPELLQKLHSEYPRLNRQLERLRANRFEVAVIGLEKAGKSALLNAWLGQEILPSARERCTFTSIEIWSAQTEHDQLLSIQYYTEDEISQLQQQRQEAIAGAGPLLSDKEKKEIQEDFDDTEKNLGAIHEFTRQKLGFSQAFVDISEINEHLQAAVFKNRAQSLAIKRIQLKTVRLRSDRDIIFHDVPGFNSGILMHAEQAIDRLKNCDAIIYAKEMKQPSITGPEKDMLLVVDAEDPTLHVSDKVFVVLTQADALDDPIDFKETYSKHQLYWPAVPERRLIPVCARAHLVEFGIPSEDTLRRSKSADDKGKLKKIGITDGIPILKESVNYYIDNERAAVLAKRCDALVYNMRQITSEILAKLDPIYGAINDNDFQEDDLLGKEFNQWWGREWQRIKKDFDVWYAESIQGRQEADALGAEHQELAALRSAYDQKIEALLANLNTAQPDELKRIYTAGGTLSMPDSREGNYKIREELFREIQKKFETELTDQLAQALQALIDQIVHKTEELLWDTEDVRKTLLHSHIDEGIEQARIRHGFQVLFLRFGRVAVEAFIAKPLQARERLLSERAAEIKTLEAFYQGPDKNKQEGGLTHYLRYGLWALLKTAAPSPTTPRSTRSTAKAAATAVEVAVNLADAVKNLEEPEKAPEPTNFDEVVEEISNDLAALQDYLKNSVFYAAGFITYCNQELERIRNRFKEMEDNDRQWIGIIRTAVKYEKNPKIPYSIAHSRRDFRLRREIALEIKEVKAML